MRSSASARKALGLLTTIATMAALTIPLIAQPALANHGTRTLEAGHCTNDPTPPTPCPDSDAVVIANEVDSNAVGSPHTMRAVLSSAADAGSGPINIDWEIESGPGAGDGNNFNPPDLTCTVPVGEDSCEVNYVSTVTGTDSIRVWIDHDNNNATADSETYDATEERLAGNDDCGENTNDPLPPTTGDCANVPPTDEPGSKSEPDGTDVIEKTWTVGQPSTLDCEPETAINPSTGSGSSEEYTCTVRDAFGNGLNGVNIDGENMNGANDPDNSAPATGDQADYDHENPNETTGSRNFCTTGSNGSCSDTVDAIDGEAGSADICFWVDSDSDAVFGTQEGVEDGGDCDLESQGQNDNDLTDTVRKTWAARSASGGGVDAEPETDQNQTGDNHTITATVYDQFGAPFQSNTQVKFEFFQGSPSDTDQNSPQSPDRTCTTNNSSTCSITYTSANPGKDRVCVWTNANPTMSGDNQSGTCDGEGLTDADDDPSGADAPLPADDDVDVVEKNWGGAGAGNRLNCEPETSSGSAGTTHTVTCTVTDSTGARAGSGIQVDAEATGANDPDNNGDLTNPDFTCTTVANDPLTPTTDEGGTCQFKHGTDGGVGQTNSAGVTTYRAWIDSDNNNGTVEADTTEGRDETTTPGTKPEPDDTDVTERTWNAAPTTITIAPKTDTANVGACNPYTITATTSAGPSQGAIIDVEQVHQLATNNTPNDEPRVSFCTPPSTAGPNPSDVDTTKGDLGPNSASSPKEDPDNPGTAGGETVNPTDAAGKVTIGIKIEALNNSNGTGQVNVTVWHETTPDDDDPNAPQDTATKIWEIGEGRTIDCQPPTATKQTGETHTITCTVKDRNGSPVQGEGVTFSETGAGTIQGSSTDTSDDKGEVTVVVTSSEAGEQTVTATITDDLQGNEPSEVDECDKQANDPTGAPAGQCSDTSTVTWQGDPECSDGVDNDQDGDTDFPADDGCENANDDDESNDPAECPGFEGDSRNHIVGTAGDDQLEGTPGNDIICGLGGDDVITGGAGNDLLLGGDGNDDLRGDDGNDEIRGENGKDAMRGNNGSDVLFGGNQNDVGLGNAGSDLLVGNSGKDIMRGGKDNDTLRGGGNDDTLQGGTGNDLLKGGGGKDTLRGGAGDDLLRGGKGNDSLRGGANDDRMNGGKGTDSCVGGPGRDRSFGCEK